MFCYERYRLFKLIELLEEASPLITVAAHKGGSLFYKHWLDRAKELGVEIGSRDSEG